MQSEPDVNVVVTVNIPAISELVSFLKEIRDRAVQQRIDKLTEQVSNLTERLSGSAENLDEATKGE